MIIREATQDDNLGLQDLQARCSQAAKSIVSIANTPDFFARAKAYEQYKVYAACEDDQIIGSSACAIRNATVNGEVKPVAYGFQALTSPEYRRRGVESQLQRHRLEYAVQQGAVLLYGLVMDGNTPAMRYAERDGAKRHRALVMPGLLVYKEMRAPALGDVRQAGPEDLEEVANLLNSTWKGYELYEPASAEGITRFIHRTPAYDLDNLMVLEKDGNILACLGYWDWSQVMRVTMESISFKMRAMGWMLRIAGVFRSVPRPVKPGDTLKQVMLTPIGFKERTHLSALLRHVNNHVLQRGTEQIFCVCERDHPMLKSMGGFIRIDTTMNLYFKSLADDGFLANRPVYIDGIDL
jgi:GNAT superfamily N-acetyltransferase